MLRLSDYERAAKGILPSFVSNFILFASEERQTYEENFKAMRRYLLKPRMLRDVSNIDISTTVLGHKISFPVCASPTSIHGQAHGSAEIGSATGVTAAGVIFTLSSFSSLPIEDVARACSPDSCLFLNIYLFTDRELTTRVVRRAEASGFKALVVTIDSPCAGPQGGKRKGKLFREQIARSPYTYANLIPKDIQFKEEQYEYSMSIINPRATWADITWLKSITSLPLIFKGILCAEDAELAVEFGAAGILVSNHGGRQLAGTTATMDVLREVVLAVRGRCEVYVDGGFRTGTDVLKALALGARAVFIGRPVLYALAHGGSESVKDMMEILKGEFKAAMQMSGCSKVSDITPALVRNQRELHNSRL